MRKVSTRSLGEGGSQEAELFSHFSEMAGRLADEWPRTSNIIRAVADRYSREAHSEDLSAERYRLGLDS